MGVVGPRFYKEWWSISYYLSGYMTKPDETTDSSITAQRGKSSLAYKWTFYVKKAVSMDSLNDSPKHNILSFSIFDFWLTCD